MDKTEKEIFEALKLERKALLKRLRFVEQSIKAITNKT
jgi:hypothetical protein